MLEVEKVEITNFLGLRSFSLSFKDQGPVLICGPNGSGKSSIYEAVVWCLFGKTVRQTRADDVVNDLAKRDCQVTLEGYLNGKPLKVVRYRKHSFVGNGLVVVYDGKTLEGSASEVQDQLTKLIGIDFNHFQLISSFIPDRIKMFASATPSQRSEILSSILDLAHFDKAYDKTRDALKRYELEHSETDGELRVTKQSIESVDRDLTYLRNQYAKEKEKMEKNLTDLKNAKRRAIYRLRQVEEELKSLEKGEQIDIEALRKEKDLLSRKLMEVSNKIYSTKQKISELREVEAEKYVGQKCPICEREIGPNLINKIRKHRNIQEGALMRLIKEMKEKEEKISLELNSVTKKLEHAIEMKVSVEKSRSSLLNERSQLLQQLEDIKRQTEIVDSHLLQMEEMIKRKEEELKRLQSSLSALQEKRKSLEREVYLFSLLKDAFSKKGAKLYFIKQALEKLEYVARDTLKILSDRLDLGIKVGEKDEIEIIVFRDGIEKRYEDCSSGEKHRIECALSIGLNQMARSLRLVSTNFLFMDELFDRSLDAEGQERVFEVLRKLSNDVETIFVVSHRTELQSQFQKVIAMG